MLFGNDGADFIYGGAGNDILDAGKGTVDSWQYLYGEAGDDTYVYSKDNGAVFISAQSEIVSYASADRVMLTNLSLENVTFGYLDYFGTAAAEQGNALRMSWNDGTSSGELRVALQGQNIEYYEFADGTRLSGISFDTTTGVATLTGTTGNDFIREASEQKPSMATRQ